MKVPEMTKLDSLPEVISNRFRNPRVFPLFLFVLERFLRKLFNELRKMNLERNV